MLIFFVIFLRIWVIFVTNIFFWWGVFLLMTIFIVFINKKSFRYSTIFNYFVLQERLGLLFLLLFMSSFPMFIIMIKVGMAPLHFWLFKIVSGIYGFNLVWFLTVHKLPFLLVFLQLYNVELIYFLLLGILLCIFQMFVIKTFKRLLVLSSVESFNWIVVGLIVSFLNVLILFFYYLFLIIILIFKFDLLKGLLNNIRWELVLVFIRIPFTVRFFIKIFSLMEILKSLGVYVMLLLFIMFLSVLSLSFWLIAIRTLKLLFNKYNYVFVAILVTFTFVVVV